MTTTEQTLSHATARTALNPVIVDTAHSPHTQLRPVALTAVTLQDTFWTVRRAVNRHVLIPAQYALCERTGRIDNFRRAAGTFNGPFQGMFFNDSDVYKLVEAAAWQLADGIDVELNALIDTLIGVIAAAQQADGYLNTYFMFEREAERWTNFDLHEMYCAGHLFQAAVAHHRVTGKTTLLDVAIRFADCICARFGPEAEGKQFGLDGHPEIEMALVELYRVTHDEKYLKQVRYFIAVRGSGRLQKPFSAQNSAYYQDRVPFIELTRLEGHAVRAVYLNCGAADMIAEAADPAVYAALEQMWQTMTTRQMYVHGGLGSRYETEGMGQDYELPNSRAYAETCASVANLMWNWRMLMLEGDARYADLIEWTLYNSVLSGVSLDGGAYFYQNPLNDNGQHRREEWFTVSCCPGNIARLLAMLPGYLYSTSAQTLWVHLYASSTVATSLPDGKLVEWAIRTDYPWSGEITLQPLSGNEHALAIRIPAWAGDGWRIDLNGQPAPGELKHGYWHLHRAWQPGDTLTVHLPMPVRLVETHPFAVENQGRVALMRGPLLYCIEAVDHRTGDVRLMQLVDGMALTATFNQELLGGVVIIQGEARIATAMENWGDVLYQSKSVAASDNTGHMVPLTAIPYYAWANRAVGSMQVWLPLVHH